MIRPLLPRGVGNDTREIDAQIDPRLLPQAKRPRRADEGVRPRLKPRVAEVGVAAFHERVRQVDEAVPPAAGTAQAHRAQFEHARALERLGGGEAERQGGQRRDGLEGGAGRIRPAARAVEEWLVGVFRETVVKLVREDGNEIVGVEARCAREREDVAGTRIEDDTRPAHPIEDALGGGLNPSVEGERQVGSFLRRQGRPLADREATRIHQDFLLARHTAQKTVVVKLHARAAAHLWREEVEPLVAGLRVASVAPHVAEDVRGQRALRIDARLACVEDEPRKAILLLGEDRHLAIRHVGEDLDGTRERLADVAADVFFGEGRGSPQRLRKSLDTREDGVGRLVPRLFLETFRQALNRPHEAVVREDDAVAVENAATRAGRLDAADGLARGGVAVVRRREDLHVAQAQREQKETEEKDGRDDEGGHIGFQPLGNDLTRLHGPPPCPPRGREAPPPRDTSPRRWGRP